MADKSSSRRPEWKEAILIKNWILIGADLTACFGGGLPVLMAGDLDAKHVDWNSRLNTRRGKLLRDYADENCCLILGPETPTTNPYNPSATPDVLDIVLTKDLSFPVYLTSCSALSSDHLSVLIDTACRSSFQHPSDRPDFRRTDWANFQTNLKRSISLRSGIAQRDGNRDMRWKLLRRRSEGSGSIYFQVSPVWRPTASDTGWHSEWDTPEEPAAEAVAGHQSPRSESWGQPPAEVGDPPIQRVGERPVECDTRIPRSRRPIAVEDDQTGDENSYSVSPGHPGGNRSLRLRESRSPCRQSGKSVSAGDRSHGPGSCWDGWRGAEVLLPDRCQRTQFNRP